MDFETKKNIEGFGKYYEFKIQKKTGHTELWYGCLYETKVTVITKYYIKKIYMYESHSNSVYVYIIYIYVYAFPFV